MSDMLYRVLQNRTSWEGRFTPACLAKNNLDVALGGQRVAALPLF
jgi:hypothetical protein